MRGRCADVLVSGAEDAEVMVAAERWIVDGCFALLGTEAGEQRRVGAELLCAAVQLAGAAEIDETALVHTVHGAAQLDVLAAQ